MNLYKLALGGLNAAQAGIATTSHNINNSTTVGYNRQRVMTSTAGAQATSNGFIGRGVQVDTVVRSYDSFLYKQLVGAQGSGASCRRSSIRFRRSTTCSRIAPSASRRRFRASSPA